ncbi:MAG TPA: glycosidase, partial [Sphingomonas sanguinis]|nr:glycosidase [Sphingomonas sanguinis]
MMGPAIDASVADPHRKDRVADAPFDLDFNVKRIEDVTLKGPPALMARDLMSPYVWREADGRWGMMVRAVVPQGETLTDTGVIWAGWSEDGRHFTMLDAPSIAPGPG